MFAAMQLGNVICVLKLTLTNAESWGLLQKRWCVWYVEEKLQCFWFFFK